MNKIRLLAVAVVFVMLLSSACAPSHQSDVSDQTTAPQTQSPESTGTPELISAPDFTVYDQAGKEVRLSDFFGKPIVLNFWASWCGPCKMEMPDFNDKYLELSENVQFLMINLTDGSTETADTASQFIAEKGYSFPVFYDTASSAAMVYGVYSIPTTYFINDQGHIIAQATGAIDAETLQRGIDMIYSG